MEVLRRTEEKSQEMVGGHGCAIDRPGVFPHMRQVSIEWGSGRGSS